MGYIYPRFSPLDKPLDGSNTNTRGPILRLEISPEIKEGKTRGQ
jgi:hypothetical protein